VYVSQPLYVRFPTAVESISLWSVLSAQSTGDALFHWDARGMVTCKIPESVDHATYSSANSNVGSENPMPFDLTQQPNASDPIIQAKPASFEESRGCTSPSEAPVATHKYVPPWPLAGAANSTYRAARKFCETEPGYYLYVITFGGSVP
jgi:hypothetical protein